MAAASLGLLVVMGVLTWPAYGSQHGVNVMLNQHVLDQAAAVGVNYVYSEFQSAPIPDMADDSGHFQWWLTGIRLNMLNKPGYTAGLSNGRITVSLFNVGVSASADWRYKLHKLITIRDHGSVDVRTTGLTMNAIVHFDQTADGHVTVVVDSSTAHVSDLDIDIHGKAKFIYNLFKGPIKRRLISAIQDQLAKLAPKGVAVYNEKLRTSGTFVKVADRLYLNYTLAGEPTVQYGKIIIPMDGGVSLAKGGSNTQVSGLTQTQAVPPPPPTNKDVCITVGSYPADTLFSAFFHRYGESVNITKDDIPEDFRDYAELDDEVLRIILGDPDQLPYDGYFKLSAYLKGVVSTHIGGDVISISANLDIWFYQQYQGRERFLFNLLTTASATATPKMNIDSIMLVPGTAKFAMTTGRSTVGTIKADSVAKALSQQVEKYLKKHAEDVAKFSLAYTFPLPKIPGTVYLNDKNLTVVEGAINVCSDVKVDFTKL